MTYRIEARQAQSIALSPQVLQSIKLLQLPQSELYSFVESELERNPLLSRPKETEANDVLTAAAAQGAKGVRHGSSDHSLLARGDVGDNWLEETVTGKTTLTEHLESQLRLATTDPFTRMAGQQIIHSLEQSGYLLEDLGRIAMRLGTEASKIEAALALVQTFEPSGIAARSPQECLALQLRERDRLDPAMQALLDNLELVAAQDHEALKEVCCVDAEDLDEMLIELRSLDPRPGSRFDHEVAETLIPDVLVRREKDGGWKVQIHEGSVPRVLVNRDYFVELSSGPVSKTDRAYLSESLQSANWLIKCLDQRVQTTLAVAAEIVRQQSEFFEKGIEFLKPLCLRRIADVLGINVSTVSRVTSSKYMATPRGNLPMKSFFPAGLKASDGGVSHSADKVRFQIQKLVSTEPSHSPLSDDAIVKRLREMDISIARRTVTKYREALRIPSSLQRARVAELRAHAGRTDASTTG